MKRKEESDLTAFTRAITNDVKELLFQSHICGVSWGHTLASIVSYLQTPEMRPSRGRERNIFFVPVCGESIEDYMDESDDLDAALTEDQGDMTSSSVLSLQLDRIFNGDVIADNKPERRRKQLTLRAIPALIPMEFDEDEEVDVIRKFINRIRPYNDIFSKNNGWIDKIDTLITSAGSVGGPMSRLKNSFARAGGINREELQQLKEIVSGDLAGVVFKSEEHDLNPKQEEVFKKLVDRWTGIKFCHIKNCADRAYLHGKPGVIIIAYGEDRAQSVFQGIKKGLINRLFIDEKLANELIELIENKGTR